MLLFRPSPGQINDRMAILMLKMNVAEGADSILMLEWRECHRVLDDFEKTLTVFQYEKYIELKSNLYKQNQAQWDFENQLRKTMSFLESGRFVSRDELIEFAKLAIGTHRGNENRARLVAEIDELFGCPSERKVYR